MRVAAIGTMCWLRLKSLQVPLEDTLAALGSCDAAVLKSRWAIHFVNELGLD